MARQLTLFNLPPNPDFELFWSKYPRKEAKIYARTVFERVVKSRVVKLEDLMKAVERFSQHVIGKDQDKIPHPSTWLNQGRWDDEYKHAGADDFNLRAHKRSQIGISKYQ